MGDFECRIHLPGGGSWGDKGEKKIKMERDSLIIIISLTYSVPILHSH